jgi:peptide/nickel transport system permease protein
VSVEFQIEASSLGETKQSSEWRQMLAKVTRSPTALIGLSLVGFWITVALLAPILPIYPPNDQDMLAMGNPYPSFHHLLGTDLLGRDLLSRLFYGARTILQVAPLAVATAMLVGIVIGLLAGYYGGYVDMFIGRLSDIVLAFPVIVLYVILISNIGPSILNIIVATTVASAPGIGRIVRSLVLVLKQQGFVDAAKMRGESTFHIMFVEILPNCRGPLIVDACLRLGYTIITIGILGFLGLGLPPPTPDWGGMVRETTTVISVWPHMSLIPSVAIVSLVLGLNLLADGIGEGNKRR